LLLAQRPGFKLRHVWVLSVATMTVQAGFTLWLLGRELRRRTTVAAG
jgi:hypothetical protein